MVVNAPEGVGDKQTVGSSSAAGQTANFKDVRITLQEGNEVKATTLESVTEKTQEDARIARRAPDAAQQGLGENASLVSNITAQGASSSDTSGLRAGRKPPLLKSIGRVARRNPCVILAPAFISCLCIALCIYGISAAADKDAENNKQRAQAAARETADAFVLQLNQASQAALTLATHVVAGPNWSQVGKDFWKVAPEAFKQANATVPGALTELHIIPFGKVEALYPPLRNVTTDLFAQASLRPWALKTVAMNQLIVLGPQQLVVPSYSGPIQALLARYPIFISGVDYNETFENPSNKTGATNCPVDLCYQNATRSKFWGFTVAAIYADALISGKDTRLNHLRDLGYYYTITRYDTDDWTGNSTATVVAQSNPPPSATEVSVPMTVPGSNWTLIVEAEGGWVPTYRKPLEAMVVVVSVILGVLLFVMLYSMNQAAWLLHEQLRTNKELADTNCRLAETTRVLEDEKANKDALLARQYDLISCLARDQGASSSNTQEDSAASKEALTLERIEHVRRAISIKAAGASGSRQQTSPEEIVTTDLLGEGTFGKVYKGLWRGTAVAVKTMILPANMSGQEKREKMAIMEAAISSSLAHPNIVQTYTYSIRPLRDTESGGNVDAAVVVTSDVGSTAPGGAGTTTTTGTKLTVTPQKPGSGSANIHSYEVRLVCEFCDKGCLRDALDCGAFMSPRGLNYWAILDTAADIAKAMLHLHYNDVLHSDLKARNVLLASSGSEGRGARCKVADFGLAVRMDSAETHMSGLFQGTLTHMAPEVMLEGRVSKAADVYAFGITMWELFTCGHPFQGTPRMLLGHQITREHRRPVFTPVTPPGYKTLAERCWDPVPDKRPSFDEVLRVLNRLRADLSGSTPLLAPYTVPKALPRAGAPQISPSQVNAMFAAGSQRASPGVGNALGSGTSGADTAVGACPLPQLPSGSSSSRTGHGPGAGRGGGAMGLIPAGIIVGGDGESESEGDSSSGVGGGYLPTNLSLHAVQRMLPMPPIGEHSQEDATNTSSG